MKMSSSSWKSFRLRRRPLVLMVMLLLTTSAMAAHSFTFVPGSKKLIGKKAHKTLEENIPDLHFAAPNQLGKLSNFYPKKTLERALSIRSGNMIPSTAPPPGYLRRTFPNFPWHRLPDYLTYFRCVAIPILMYTFYKTHDISGRINLINSTIFALASFTDWLDGFLARRWQISTAFGAFLDPVADKLMVSTALILLSGKYGAIIAIPSCIILAREIAVSALREWMAQRGLRDVVKVGYQGKVKTAGTMVALTVLLLVTEMKGWIWKLGVSMLYLSALVTITSGSVYFQAAASVLFEDIPKSPSPDLLSSPPPPPAAEIQTLPSETDGQIDSTQTL